MPKEITEQTLIGDILFEWDVREYDQHDRPRSWYIVMLVLGIVLLFFGMFTDNFLFSLIILLFGIILYLQAHQKPIEVPVAITEFGIIIGRRYYTYTEFSKFFILFEPGVVKSIFFVPKSAFQSRIELDLGDMNAVEIRSLLREVIEEDIEVEDLPLSEQFRRGWKLH